MKRLGVVLLSISVLVLVLILGSTQLGGNAFAQPPSAEVTILRCSVSAPVSSIPVAHSSSASANAPVIARGTTCAQGLALLLNEGFEIVALESAGTGDRMDLYYTLATGGP